MTNIQARIADVIGKHRHMPFNFSWDVCTGCEWHGKSRDAHTRHLTDMLLSQDGIAIVELPEPDNEHELSWSTDDYATAVWDSGEVQLSGLCNQGYRQTFEPIKPAQARALAAALIAAAQEAEPGQ